MNTPSVFLIGKLNSVIDEINKGTGSTWALVTYGENSGLKISLTLPDLTNDAKILNETTKNLIKFFGLEEDKCRILFHHSSRKTEIEIVNEEQGLQIVAESMRM